MAAQQVPAAKDVPVHPYADGVRLMNEGVTAPKPIFMPDPQYSKEARKKKISGNCLVGLTVDAEGIPQDVHVVHSLAEGQEPKLRKAALSLDEKALEVVRQYRFTPATREGKAVTVQMNIEVNFQIF